MESFWATLKTELIDGQASRRARRAKARRVAEADEVLCMIQMVGVPGVLALVRRAAGAGVLGSQLILGQVLLGIFGGKTGAPIDLAEGHRWVRRAADVGWASALTPLAVTYLWSLGTPEDSAEALRRVAAAALAGDPEGGLVTDCILHVEEKTTLENLGAQLRAAFATVPTVRTPVQRSAA